MSAPPARKASRPPGPLPGGRRPSTGGLCHSAPDRVGDQDPDPFVGQAGEASLFTAKRGLALAENGLLRAKCGLLPSQLGLLTAKLAGAARRSVRLPEAEPGLFRAQPALAMAERRLPRSQFALLCAESSLRLEDGFGLAKRRGIADDIGGAPMANVEQTLAAGPKRPGPAHVFHRPAHRAAAAGSEEDVRHALGGLDGARSDDGIDRHDGERQSGQHSQGDAAAIARYDGERLDHFAILVGWGHEEVDHEQ